MTKALFGIYNPFHKGGLLLFDVLSLFIIFRTVSKVRLPNQDIQISYEYIGLNIIVVLSLFIGNAYTSKPLGSKPKLPLNTIFTVLVSTIPCTIYIYILGPEKFTGVFGRGIFPISMLIFSVMAMLGRLSLNHLFRFNQSDKNIAIIGQIRTKQYLDESLAMRLENITFEFYENMPETIDSGRFDGLVITPEFHPSDEQKKTLTSLRVGGLPIFSLPDFFERFLFLIPIREIDDDWLIRARGFSMLHSSVAVRLKRLVDLILATALLIITIPLLLIVCPLVKLTSRGPIFYSQTRVGYQGSNFTLFKLRTMTENAETQGSKWAEKDDPRITPIGHFLRKSRIDELPQCWNILKGEMSFIGPRPERPEFTKQLSKSIPFYDLRAIVKPGLTGWAQVSYPYGASTEDALRKLQFDLYYIKNYSLLLDLNILLRTVMVTLQRSGR